MTPTAFLELALALPEVVAGSHMGHGDLRVRTKIFATPADREGGKAVLKLTPEQQQMLCEAEPAIFAPVPGGWGARGWTHLTAAAADPAAARSALWTAWRNVAPKALRTLHP
ncbi:MAG: MmcQ/YjbR family DNA-binding protein [Alphaproteobacteria bacterium]|nr:MmcQ/YjbR family DNA-binding protein [Alphaproteobacteria bacterium]